jgi:hypothetical protein
MKMDQENQINTVTLRSKPPVLRSESAEEYISLHQELVRELEPNGPIEEIYIEDITALIWDVQRLRNFKVSAMHQASLQALTSILKQLLPFKPKAEALAKGWFEDAGDRKQVSEILKRFDLDESAIEAEAMKLASEQLEWLDKALALASSRLEKELRFVKSYRDGFADNVRRQTDRLLLADDSGRTAA